MDTYTLSTPPRLPLHCLPASHNPQYHCQCPCQCPCHCTPRCCIHTRIPLPLTHICRTRKPWDTF